MRFTPARIVEAARNLDTPDFSNPGVKELIDELKEEHVIVEMSALHYGMGDKFPLDNCKFYGKYSPNGMSVYFFAYSPFLSSLSSHSLLLFLSSLSCHCITTGVVLHCL